MHEERDRLRLESDRWTAWEGRHSIDGMTLPVDQFVPRLALDGTPRMVPVHSVPADAGMPRYVLASGYVLAAARAEKAEARAGELERRATYRLAQLRHHLFANSAAGKAQGMLGTGLEHDIASEIQRMEREDTPGQQPD